MTRLRESATGAPPQRRLTSSPESPVSSSFSPRTLIVTVLGAFGRSLGSWVAVADLIDLMEEVGVGAQAVRAAVSRLKKRGFLLSEQVDGIAGYRLTPQAEAILARGDRRIFRTWHSPREADWIVVVFSIPEAERERRHILRSRLAWLGFGNAAPGVWVAPPHLEEEARETIEAEGLAAYVSLFRSRYVGFDPITEAVESWWDLKALEKLYEEFIDGFAPLAERYRGPEPVDQVAAFADYVHILTYWRVLPFLDPGLPPEILPPDWSGERATSTFMKLHATLSGPALQHVRHVVRHR